MTDAEIIAACEKAEIAFLKDRRPVAIRLGKWLMIADKRDYKQLDWVYEVAKAGVKPIKGNRNEIVQAIREHELVA